MKLLIIRDENEYVICRESKDYIMFRADRYTSLRNGRQLDIMNKKKELLLRGNKKRKKWFGPQPEVHYTVKVSSSHIYEVRWRGHWEMSDGKTIYEFYALTNHTQYILRDDIEVAKIRWEETRYDEDIIHVTMEEQDDLLQIVGFLLIFTMVSKFGRNDKRFGNKLPIDFRSGL
jgi:hypothetical protein